MLFRSALFDIRNYLYILISFLPAIFWYMHGRNMHLNFTQEQAFNYRMINWFDIKKLSDIRLYVNLLQIYSGIFLTPIGLSLFIGGFFIKTKHRERLIWPWLFGSVLFLIVFATHIEDPYYNLNFLPVASVFIARMIIFLQQSDRKKTFLDSRWGRIILIALILPFWLRYAAYAYIVPKGYRYIPEAGIEIQNITQKEDLVIASSAGGPQGLYFCDRKGWGFTLPQNQQEEAPAVRDLEQYIDKGAKYFVSMKIDDFENTVYFKQYLFQNYKTVAYQKDKFIIFGLEKQRKER